MFDRQIEARFGLILPENYFDRYREHLGRGKSGTEAWEATENELFEATGFRKYLSVDSFRHALQRESELIAAPRVSFLVPKK